LGTQRSRSRKALPTLVGIALLIVLVFLPLQRVAAHDIRAVDFLQIFASGAISGVILGGWFVGRRIS
jgi:hypothetical protein